jgi:predicted nucleic acid-binding protein
MILVDATTLLSLGNIGELGLLLHFNRKPAVLPFVDEEVTSEPARTNLNRFYDHEGVRSPSSGFVLSDRPTERARQETERMLGQSEIDGDFEIIFVVCIKTNAEHPVGVISDDRRVRTIADGLGATITGTIGVVVRAVEEELSEKEGKKLIREIDRHGLHMTGELREKADELIEEAAE